MPLSEKRMAIHFVYEPVTTMHKILNILRAAIHFPLGGEHNAYHALIHASLSTGGKEII